MSSLEIVTIQLQKEASEKGIRKEDVELLIDQRVRSMSFEMHDDGIEVQEEHQKEVVSLQSQLAAKEDLLRQYSVRSI